MFDYPVILEPAEEGGFVVTFPDVPEAITQGEDEEEALLHAQDALETALSMYVEDVRDLPKPPKPGDAPPYGQGLWHPQSLPCIRRCAAKACVRQN